MNRNYLLKVIEKNFFVLDKDELSREIADNPFFDQSLKNLVVEQSISLNDKEMFATHHSQVYETIKELLRKFSHNNYDYEQEKLADASLLVVSVYYHYSEICSSTAMYVFLRNVIKEKTLLA